MQQTKQRRFIQCDVFSPVPTRGNALAVVVDAEGLSDAQMQQFAAWTNLAETTFLLPPDDASADYKVRIFTPTREMPFAGHPTLGSCAAWLHCGGQPASGDVVKQQCGVGIIEIDISQPELAFRAPPTQIETMLPENFEQIVAALAIPHGSILRYAQLTNGPVWQVFELDSADSVLALDSSTVKWPMFKALGFIGAHGPSASGSEGGASSRCDYEVRMLAPSSGMSEDPITGSLNSALAHWLQVNGMLTDRITVAQGTAIGRHGRVSIRPEVNGDILIGGQVNILIEGQITL